MQVTRPPAFPIRERSGTRRLNLRAAGASLFLPPVASEVKGHEGTSGDREFFRSLMLCAPLAARRTHHWLFPPEITWPSLDKNQNAGLVEAGSRAASSPKDVAAFPMPCGRHDSCMHRSVRGRLWGRGEAGRVEFYVSVDEGRDLSTFIEDSVATVNQKKEWSGNDRLRGH